jgi:tetratricopeptide (TPR) repeat protein
MAPLDSDLPPLDSDAAFDLPLAIEPPDLSSPLTVGPALVISPAASTVKTAREVPGKSRTLWIAGISGGVLLLAVVAVVASRSGNEQPRQDPAAKQPLVQELEEPAPAVAATTSQKPPKQPIETPVETPKPPKPAQTQRKPPAVTTNAKPPEEEQPGEITKAAPPPRVPPPSRQPGGLTGVSRQYDDLDCMRIQAQHSIRVPAAANMLEVDGQRLPIANLPLAAESRAPFLFLPRGTHAVRFRRGENPVQVTINSDLSQVYHDMRAFFDAGGNVRQLELLSRGAKAMDVHSAPFLLNLMGASHLNKDQTEAAERKFRRSLRVNPFFAPAHLNLAALHLKRGSSEEARAELDLADATNVGNCFGLSPGIADLRRKLAHTASAAEVPLANYQSQESLAEEDKRITALMQGLSKYAVEDAERGKILNNLAVHFAESGRYDLALDHYRSALGVLKLAGPERFNLAKQVLANMGDACRKAKYDEADEYDRMRTLVSP